MIFGVTVDANGEPIKRQIINRKLGVGLPPDENRNHPKRFDFFIVTKRTGNKGQFELDKEFTEMLGKKYGEPLMEVDVILLSNDREEIFRSELAWRTQDRANALLCHGDGIDATRLVKAFSPEEKAALNLTNVDPKEWIEIKGCGKGCPHLAKKECKPSGDLYFMFPEDPVSGSVATLHTGGWEPVKRLAASLAKIEADIAPHGGQLLGLQLKLVARWYRTSYVDRNGPQIGRQLAYNLEWRQADAKQLMPSLIHESRRLAMSIGEVIEVEPLPDEVIADEFYPTPEQQETQRQAEANQPEPNKPVSVLDRVVSQERGSAGTTPAVRATPPVQESTTKPVSTLTPGLSATATLNPDIL